MNTGDQTVVVFTGAGLSGSGYPNARNVCRVLSNDTGIKVFDRVGWLPENFHLWKLARGSILAKLTSATRLFLTDIFSLLRALCMFNKSTLIIPYPYIGALLLLSLLPTRYRPSIVADVYNSLWISLVEDRRLGDSNGKTSRLLWRLESRALRCADVLVLDTEANAGCLAELYSLPKQSLATAPLALDPSWVGDLSSRTPRKEFRVLFFGTMIPLHGLELISEAVRRFSPDDEVQFDFVGSGQEEVIIKQLASELSFVTWIHEWQSPEQLRNRIAKSSVVLGVFGGAGKAARVLPWKLYIAMANGLPVITQSKYSLPSGCPPLPVLHADTSDELAARIRDLRDQPTLRTELGQAARRYFVTQLSDSAVVDAWKSAVERARTIRAKRHLTGT